MSGEGLRSDVHGPSDSLEFARWQGHIDTTLDGHGRRLDTINGDVRSTKDAMVEIKVNLAADMASVKAKVAVFSAIGGLVGAGAVSAMFALLTK
jgi:hypothetical protein